MVGWQASIRVTWARGASQSGREGPGSPSPAPHVASSSVPCTHTDMRERAAAALRCMQLMFSIRSISGTVKLGLTMHLLSMHTTLSLGWSTTATSASCRVGLPRMHVTLLPVDGVHVPTHEQGKLYTRARRTSLVHSQLSAFPVSKISYGNTFACCHEKKSAGSALTSHYPARQTKQLKQLATKIKPAASAHVVH
jgi:hypothetical protein